MHSTNTWPPKEISKAADPLQSLMSQIDKLEQDDKPKFDELKATVFHGKCFDCGQQGHKRGDPSCPKAKSGGGARIATILKNHGGKSLQRMASHWKRNSLTA